MHSHAQRMTDRLLTVRPSARLGASIPAMLSVYHVCAELIGIWYSLTDLATLSLPGGQMFPSSTPCLACRKEDSNFHYSANTSPTACVQSVLPFTLFRLTTRGPKADAGEWWRSRTPAMVPSWGFISPDYRF